MQAIILGGLFTFLALFSQSAWAKNIDYCVDPSWAPFESIANNEHVGLSKQYIDLIAKYSDLEFTLYPTSSWPESLQALQEQKCLLTPFVFQSEERKKNLLLSDSYFNATNVIYGLYHTKMMAGLSSLTTEVVAVVKGYHSFKHIRKKYPKIKLIKVENEEAGIKKLSNQQVDLFIGTFYSSSQVIHKLGINNVRVVGISELENKLHVGLNYSSGHLLPKINAAIAQITIEDHRNVFAKLHNTMVVSTTNYQLVWQIIVFGFTIISIGGVIYFRVRRQREVLSKKNKILEELRTSLVQKNKELAELTIKDHLTGLFNRLYLSEHIDENIHLKKRYNLTSCLIVLDVDNFKRFNDVYGHSTGDKVIQLIADVLREVSRDTDICGRWGGEEYAILCPATDLNNAFSLAQRFQEKLKDYRHIENEKITCSIGIAELANETSLAQWFSRADAAMYLAKANGKDCIRVINEQ